MSDSGINCQDCTQKKKELRNCGNRVGWKDPIVGKNEWGEWPASLKPAIKMGDLKLYECPLTAIKPITWEIIRIVNQTTDVDGHIVHLPYHGAYLDQPEWYRKAVEVTQKERADHRRKQAERGKKG